MIGIGSDARKISIERLGSDMRRVKHSEWPGRVIAILAHENKLFAMGPVTEELGE